MEHIDQTDQILPLELKEVSWKPGVKRLVKDMNFTLEAGSRTILLGPNGAGKSLLLRLCHGLLKPSAGQIIWHGPGGDDPVHRQAMVFQRPIMLRRSVIANLDYAMKLRGWPREKRLDLAQEALKLIGLSRLAEVPARVLSGGEQQRLAVARAWCLAPKVLFLDEPTANLDPTATHAIEDAIQAIHEMGTKIVMTTHDLDQARRLADEVMFMYRGRLLERAPADQFFERPENDLAQEFIQGKLLWWNRRPATPPAHWRGD